jgi:hypothetical protein
MSTGTGAETQNPPAGDIPGNRGGGTKRRPSGRGDSELRRDEARGFQELGWNMPNLASRLDQMGL